LSFLFGTLLSSLFVLLFSLKENCRFQIRNKKKADKTVPLFYCSAMKKRNLNAKFLAAHEARQPKFTAVKNIRREEALS
jgi:hypothetical protein